jgi:hypothetical protein
MEKGKDGVTQNGWNEYSKLVLAELVRLNESDDKIQETLNEINLKLGKFDVIEKDVEELVKWKRYMNDVASPNTIKEMKKDVSALNVFKTVAITVWTVVQLGFAVFIALFTK